MNLKDYFNSTDKKVHKFSSSFPNCVVNNADDLWNNFISLTKADKNSVLAWHDLLIEYIFKTDNPLLLCRLYESGGYTDKNGIRIDEIRRTALTIDGNVRYMFVSNYDAAEMFNIVKQKIDADIKLFSDMINNKEYKFHYQNKTPIVSKKDYINFKNTENLPYPISSKSIQEESYILSGYHSIGTVKSSILNQSNRYLAHIIGVKDTPYLLPSGKLVNGSELKKILSKGDISDWTSMPNSERKINTDLDDNDIMIIKAHFLRLFDPLNYFATPSKSNHIVNGVLAPGKNIGEYWEVQEYVEYKYEKEYGKKYLDEFRKYALVPTKDTDKYKKLTTTGQKITFTSVKIDIGINSGKGGIKIKKVKPKKNGIILALTKKYIVTKNISTFDELNLEFPKIASLLSNISTKNSSRYFKEIITLPSNEQIRITNQIGDGDKIPKNRNFTTLIAKFKNNGITL